MLERPPRKRKTERSIAEIFGANLRAARLAKQMTQAQLAYASGISQNRIPGIKSGKTVPLLSTAQALATAVGVPLPDLLPR